MALLGWDEVMLQSPEGRPLNSRRFWRYYVGNRCLRMIVEERGDRLPRGRRVASADTCLYSMKLLTTNQDEDAASSGCNLADWETMRIHMLTAMEGLNNGK
jgi:hypothetical protein